MTDVHKLKERLVRVLRVFRNSNASEERLSGEILTAYLSHDLGMPVSFQRERPLSQLGISVHLARP